MWVWEAALWFDFVVCPHGLVKGLFFQFNTHEIVLLFLSVEWLIVDESDKLFEDGKTGFRDQLDSIFLACTSHKVRRAMFSAAFAYDVEQWCKLNLDSVSIGARNSTVETRTRASLCWV